MKRLFTILSGILFSTLAAAQTPASWTWAQINANTPITINPAMVPQSVAAHGNKALWCNIINKKALVNAQMGDYAFTEYDTSGMALASTTSVGKLSVLSSQADAAGNWYVLVQYQDSLQVSGGPLLLQPPGGSDYCLFRLNAGTLSFAWARALGSDFFTSVNCFTIAGNKIYLPLDSSGVTTLITLDVATGNSTKLWSQTGQSWITSIQVDGQGNVYLVGTCAFAGMDFNGHQVTLPALFQYPQYVVRYRANGTHHWSRFMQDATCFVREFSLADDNTIYYTGPLHDTLTLGSIQLNQPPMFGSFMAARMDSLGNFTWARQLADTASGDAQFTQARQAMVGPNGSLVIYLSTSRFVNWGNGFSSITTPIWAQSGTVVSYDKNGTTLWAKDVKADYVTPQQLAVSGNNIWVTGNATDSTHLSFDALQVSVPTGVFSYYPFLARLRANAVTAGTEDVAKQAQFVIQPNPATSAFSIRGTQQGTVHVRIFDNLGKMHLDTRVPTKQPVDVSVLAKGLYFVELHSGELREVQKLLIQ